MSEPLESLKPRCGKCRGLIPRDLAGIFCEAAECPNERTSSGEVVGRPDLWTLYDDKTTESEIDRLVYTAIDESIDNGVTVDLRVPDRIHKRVADRLLLEAEEAGDGYYEGILDYSGEHYKPYVWRIRLHREP